MPYIYIMSNIFDHGKKKIGNKARKQGGGKIQKEKVKWTW